MEEEREVEFSEAEAMCEFIPEILFVMETSAKVNTNIEDAFICLAAELKVRLDAALDTFPSLGIDVSPFHKTVAWRIEEFYLIAKPFNLSL